MLEHVDVRLEAGEIVGLTGPSGVGKSTLAECLTGLLRPDSGSVRLDGEDLLALGPVQLRSRRRQLQFLFQQAHAAIHPRMTVEEALMETARHVSGLSGRGAIETVDRALRDVKMSHRRSALPAQLSGGQLRRVGLARVLLARPRVLVVDEPTAGVDASLKADLLELLAGLRDRQEMTSILLISHDHGVVRHIADRVIGLREGATFPVEFWDTRTSQWRGGARGG